jgi:hypothetical protein
MKDRTFPDVRVRDGKSDLERREVSTKHHMEDFSGYNA